MIFLTLLLVNVKIERKLLNNNRMIFNFNSIGNKIIVGDGNYTHVCLEADVVLERATAEDWKVAGIGIFVDSLNYWHLALVEAPDCQGRRHFIELKEMANGVWGNNVKKGYPVILYYEDPLKMWEFNHRYNLQLSIKDRIIVGKVYTNDGRYVWQKIYFLPENIYSYQPIMHIRNMQGAFEEFSIKSFKGNIVIVDSFGQATFMNWPSKIFTLSQLNRLWSQEESLLRSVKLDAVFCKDGYFVARKDDDNRWWLIDPDGLMFFSLGVTSINLGETYTKIPEGAESLYAVIPGFDRVPESKKNPFFPKEGNWFSYYVVNLKRRYGSNWRKKWLENSIKRLKLWGFNTIGNWSIIPEKRTIPFVKDISSYHRKIPMINQIFPDVFSFQFKSSLRRRFREALRYKTDRYLLGYFVDNELRWGKKSGDLLKDILRLPRGSPAKESLVNYFVAKYDNIERFNRAYHTDYSSFTELRKDTMSLDFIPLSDARLFTKRIAERYFKSVRDVLKEYDPNHLYLGCRFAGTEVPDEIVEVAGRYCDVLSFNIYAPIPDTVRLKQIYRLTNKPIIIGEFHFGTANYGLRPGLVQVKDQLERALFYRRYVETAASLPFVIGLHWFEYIDQPVTGRFDGENYNIGLVNVCDIPYHEFLKGVTEVNKRIYEIHRGEGD